MKLHHEYDRKWQERLFFEGKQMFDEQAQNPKTRLKPGYQALS